MSAADIINAAKFAWDVIKDNAPSADIGNSTANAVPHVDDWQALTDAHGPNSKRYYYSIGYIWPFDDYDHVQLDIRVKWEYGARYRGGGAYIPNIWVEVPDCYVGLAWHADINITVHNPSNAGTDQAPMARVPVTLRGTVHSVGELYHVERSYLLFGDGSSQIT